jgi:co-chaperonin GroES (HSP10)
MIVQPLKDRVLIAENKRDNTTESGIILEGAGFDQSKTGTVLAIGPDVNVVAVGDVVYLEWNKAAVVKIGDAQRVMVKQEFIVAVLDK